ncbi:granzyme C-like [Rattus norvegicus]|uniref:granzyme C-like n=1 Tax=Rattus norvegicus TaxID=10116 RepID=UPI002FD7AF82
MSEDDLESIADSLEKVKLKVEPSAPGPPHPPLYNPGGVKGRQYLEWKAYFIEFATKQALVNARNSNNSWTASALTLHLLSTFFTIHRSMTVTLGAHDIKAKEKTQQIIPVANTTPHPANNPDKCSNDIMLLKLVRSAKRTSNVRPLNQPRSNAHVKTGDVCYMAGWGKITPQGELPNTLREVELTVQKDRVCASQFQSTYIKASEICVGDSKSKGASFEVSWIAFNSGLCWRGKESGGL